MKNEINILKEKTAAGLELRKQEGLMTLEKLFKTQLFPKMQKRAEQGYATYRYSFILTDFFPGSIPNAQDLIKNFFIAKGFKILESSRCSNNFDILLSWE